MQKRIDWVKSQIAWWWWGLINYETMRHSHLHFVFVFIKQKEERKKVFLFCYQNSWKLYVLEGKRVYVLGWLTWSNESNQYTFDVWCLMCHRQDYFSLDNWKRGANICFKPGYHFSNKSTEQQKNLGARPRFQRNAIALLKSKSNPRSYILQLRKKLWKFFIFSNTISCWETENAMI